jgi:hypothetical protein
MKNIMMFILSASMVYAGHVGAHHQYRQTLLLHKMSMQFSRGIDRGEPIALKDMQGQKDLRASMSNSCLANAQFTLRVCTKVHRNLNKNSKWCFNSHKGAKTACAKMR